MTTPGMTLVLTFVAVLMFVAPRAWGGDRVTGRQFATRSAVIAQHGMAATSHPLATQIALDVLQQGGSAVDAAIAANAALGLMEPTGSGIGGDLFAIVWDSETQRLHGLNASGRSPLGLARDYFSVNGLDRIPSHGPLPITVPGCVDGWFELHKKFGRMPMKEVLAPAIRYANEGFPVTDLIGYYWQRSEGLARYEGFAETFLPNGRAPRRGEVFKNPKLSNTLQIIAGKGRDAFYEGELADVMDAFFRRAGCFLRKEDFAKHASTWVEPVSTNYRGYSVWELPPNGQGIAALQMLNILEAFDLASMGHNSATYLHHLVEAKKLAYEDRARFYADPEFSDIPLETLLSKEYAGERRKLFDPSKAARAYPFGEIVPAIGQSSARQAAEATRANQLSHADDALRQGDTVYLATADAKGNMVSLIQSNYRGFGSGLCPDGLGFCFQDRGELFSLEEGHPNVYEPGKRPFHTIIPSFVTLDGRPFMSFGVMGGDMQPQGHVQVLCNIIDFGMNLQEAGDAARFYHTGSSEPTGEILTGGRGVMTNGGTLSLESGIDHETRRNLTRLGHDIQTLIGPYGGYQAIMYDAKNKAYHGASESRKDGHAAGY